MPKRHKQVDRLALEFIKKDEWSMGNGQCPKCGGVPASWHGHPLHMGTKSIGHAANCPLAAALKSLGDRPLMKGHFKSDIEFEEFIDDHGMIGTRHKTPGGCPKLKAYDDKLQDDFDQRFFKMMQGG